MTEDSATGNDRSADIQELLLEYTPDKHHAATREQIENIVSDLQQPIRSGSMFSALRDRLTACEEAYELAENDRMAAQSLCPILVNVVHDEIRCRQQVRSSADSMVLSGISRDLQLAAVRSLTTIADPELVRRYERAGEPIEPLLSVLTASIEDDENTKIGLEAMNGLAALGQSRPDELSTLVTCRSFVPALCSLLTNCDSIIQLKNGTCLLAIVATRYPEEIPNTPCVRNAIQMAVEEGKQHTIAFSLVFSYDSNIDTNIRELAGVGSSTGDDRTRRLVKGAIDRKWYAGPLIENEYLPITLLSQECCFQRGWKRALYMAAIGEVVAMRPDTPEQVPEALCDRVLNRTGADKVYPAIAIGEILTDHQGILINRNNTQSKNRKWAARVVGEIVATAPDRHKLINDSLVERVKHTEGENCRLAEEALAYFVSSWIPPRIDHADIDMDSDVCPSEVPPYLSKLVKHNDDLLWRAQALGEMISYEDPEIIDGLSQSWIDNVTEKTGEARRKEAGKLGLAMGALSGELTLNTFSEHFVSKIHDATVVKHDGFAILPDAMAAAEALGIVVSYHPTVGDTRLQPLRDSVRNSTNETSKIAAQALGFIYSLPNSDKVVDNAGTDILQPLYTQLRSTAGKDRRLPAIAIGLVASLRNTDEPLQSLRDEINRVEGSHRQKAAHTLGEVLTYVSEARTDSPRTLFDEFEQSTGDNYCRAVRSVGELALVRQEQFENVPTTLFEELRTATEWERNEVAQLLGEIVGNQLNGNVVQTLARRTREEEYGDSKRSARALGEWLIRESRTRQDIPRSFYTNITTSVGKDRRRDAHALGLFVAYQNDDNIPVFDALRHRVGEVTPDVKAKSADRKHAVRVLGQIAVQCADRFDYLSDALCTRVQSSSSEDRELAYRAYEDLDLDEPISDDHELAAIAVGEIVLAGDLHAGIRNLGYRVLVGNNRRSTMALFIVAESGAVDSTQFITALSQNTTDATSATAFDLQPFLELGDTIRQQFLETLRVVLRTDPDTSCPPVVRDQIEAFVRNEAIPHDSRLVAVDILSTID